MLRRTAGKDERQPTRGKPMGKPLGENLMGKPGGTRRWHSRCHLMGVGGYCGKIKRCWDGLSCAGQLISAWLSPPLVGVCCSEVGVWGGKRSEGGDVQRSTSRTVLCFHRKDTARPTEGTNDPSPPGCPLPGLAVGGFAWGVPGVGRETVGWGHPAIRGPLRVPRRTPESPKVGQGVGAV